MLTYKYTGQSNWKDNLRGLIKEAKRAFITLLLLSLIVSAFIFLSLRAEKISHDNYCAKYPKAKYCQI